MNFTNAFHVCVGHYIRCNTYLSTIKKGRFCQPYFSNQKTETQGDYVVCPKLAIWHLAEHFNTIGHQHQGSFKYTMFQMRHLVNKNNITSFVSWCYRLILSPLPKFIYWSPKPQYCCIWRQGLEGGNYGYMNLKRWGPDLIESVSL